MNSQGTKRIMERWEQLKLNLNNLLLHKSPLLIAIDGRCGSGKTTLAARLQKEFQANLFHMDDFYLPLDLRTPEILNQPAGNIDRKRLLQEVLLPLKSERPFYYRTYSHSPVPHFSDPIKVHPTKIAIIEGSYSCHPDFSDFYDYKIFLSLDKARQWQRLSNRETSKDLAGFAKYWIPMEERYFQTYQIQSKCDLVWGSIIALEN